MQYPTLNFNILIYSLLYNQFYNYLGGQKI